ncbi:MAG: hypothetical protein KBT18_10750 [Comamonas sp.]|nr:hypothetical protein [Candidatus Comamonas equi]
MKSASDVVRHPGSLGREKGALRHCHWDFLQKMPLRLIAAYELSKNITGIGVGRQGAKM